MLTPVGGASYAHPRWVVHLMLTLVGGASYAHPSGWAVLKPQQWIHGVVVLNVVSICKQRIAINVKVAPRHGLLTLTDVSVLMLLSI